MKQIAALLALGILLSVNSLPEPFLPIAEPDNHSVIVDLCSTPVAGGKATLKIGPLKRQSDVYTGDYQMKVTPYFFKGESGKLAMVISAEALEKASRGLPIEFGGRAIPNDKSEPRQISVTATPSDNTHGTLKLSFVVDRRKLVFDTSYEIVRGNSQQAASQP